MVGRGKQTARVAGFLADFAEGGFLAAFIEVAAAFREDGFVAGEVEQEERRKRMAPGLLTTWEDGWWVVGKGPWFEKGERERERERER